MGFSQSSVTPSMSFPIPSVIPSAATALAASNSVPPPQPSSIPGYSGPTIPQLRSDPQVNGLANQVFQVLLREIPALAAPASLPTSIPNVGVPSYSPSPAPVLAPPPPPVPTPSLQHLLPHPLGGHVPSSQQPALTPAQVQLQQFQRQLDELHALHGSSHQQQFSSEARPHQARDQVPRSNVSLDSLYSASIKNAQYRASDFSKLGNFPYSPQIKQSNMNLALFSYGSLKHLLALSDGTLPLASKEEFNARLQHVIMLSWLKSF